MSSNLSFYEKVCTTFWRAVGETNFAKWGYSWFRDFLLRLKLIRHCGRQNFFLGKLRSDKTSDDLVTYLRTLGFEKDYYAWIDEGEELSLRKIDEIRYQYHLRLHVDREVRGHYEYAPDRRPLGHFFSINQESRENEFRKMLVDFLE
ncbi:MAG: hypothetical protein WC480_01240 [Patescibacteria group bacterium]